jgi:F-type H+-transporting ATPase subunit b
MIDRAVLAQLLTTAIAFALFFWIAKRLFWLSIMNAIESRQRRIQSEFDRINELETRAKAFETEYRKRIADIETEASHRMQEAVAQGRRVAEQIGEQARRDADAILERTKQSIEIEMDKARAELKHDVVRMTLQATEKIIRERLDDAKHRELVASFVDEISSRQ